jgi:hypothetical protein
VGDDDGDTTLKIAEACFNVTTAEIASLLQSRPDDAIDDVATRSSVRPPSHC